MIEGQHSKVQRIISALVVVGVLTIVFAGLGKAIAYFKTGADNGEIHIINTNILKDHSPKVIWKEDRIVDGRILNSYMRSEIEQAYIEAWYVASMSFANKDESHLEDYFAGDALDWIKDEVNDTSQYTIHQTELNHDLQLHHFTLDNQLAAFEDLGVRVVKKILDAEQTVVYEEEQVFNYDVVMILDDGRWRIKHMVKSIADTMYSKNKLGKDTRMLAKLNQMRGVNYYPASTPWFEFWENFSADTTIQDLKLAKSLDFNTVRIFLQYSVFGEEKVREEMLEKLETFLDIAEEQKIKVIVTLFDFPKGYQLINYTATDRHIEKILTRFKDHKAILAWDVKNEPDLDFNNYGEQVVTEWLAFAIKRARAYDPNHLVTIGWSQPDQAHKLSEQVDFVSFHYYDEAVELTKEIRSLREKAPGKKLVLGEFGQTSLSSLLTLYNKSESKQADYYAEILGVLKREKVSFISWALHDFEEAPSEVFGLKPWIRGPQKHYGLIRPDGSSKPVAELMKIKF